MDWEEASDVKKDVKEIIKVLDLSYIDPSRIFCYKTQGSKSRAVARIWMMPKIFQRALNISPAYVIEVLSKHYYKMTDDEKKHTLIHELLHIPKNFSGALVPHSGRSRSLHKEANRLFRLYKESKG